MRNEGKVRGDSLLGIKCRGVNLRVERTSLREDKARESKWYSMRPCKSTPKCSLARMLVSGRLIEAMCFNGEKLRARIRGKLRKKGAHRRCARAHHFIRPTLLIKCELIKGDINFLSLREFGKSGARGCHREVHSRRVSQLWVL